MSLSKQLIIVLAALSPAPSDQASDVTLALQLWRESLECPPIMYETKDIRSEFRKVLEQTKDFGSDQNVLSIFTTRNVISSIHEKATAFSETVATRAEWKDIGEVGIAKDELRLVCRQTQDCFSSTTISNNNMEKASHWSLTVKTCSEDTAANLKAAIEGLTITLPR